MEKEKYDAIKIDSDEDKFKELNIMKERLMKMSQQNRKIRELTI